MQQLIQPKRLYCITCDVLLLPDFNLSCPVCGEKLTTCWWALLHGKDKVKKECDTCNNRYWCWTHRVDDFRVPTATQKRVVDKYIGIRNEEEKNGEYQNWGTL